MAVARCIVDDVDRAIALYAALGCGEIDSWGPPFAMVTRGDLTLWLSRPGSSAAMGAVRGALVTGHAR